VDYLFLVEYHDSVSDDSVLLSVEADHGSALDLYGHVRFISWVIVLLGYSRLGGSDRGWLLAPTVVI
jgi:hypothetical protein